MIDQKIIEWVAENRKNGVNDEQIKQSLLTSGWQENDIQTLLSPPISKIPLPNPTQLTPVSLKLERVNTPYQSEISSPRNYNIYIFFFALFVIIALIIGYVFIVLIDSPKTSPTFETKTTPTTKKIIPVQKTPPPIATKVSTQATTTTTTTTTTIIPPTKQVPTTKPKTSEIDSVLADIKKGFLENKPELFYKHATMASIALFNSIEKNAPSGTSFIVNKVTETQSKITVNVTEVDNKGKTLTVNMVFIQENNEWKLDFSATMQAQ